MRILLTGGTGMVGRNIRLHPKTGEHEMVTPDSAELNLLDASATADYVRQTAPDVVVHAAGLVGGIQANIASPVRFFTENMAMGLNIIGAARAAGVPRFLNIGSSCMYPRDAQNPLREEQVLTGALEPTNEGYAIAKIGAARLCEYISREDPEHEYRTIIPCNLYGPFDKFGANAHMVPAAIAKVDAAVREGRDSVEVWGTGEARREFMFAGDLADFVFTALDRFADLPGLLNVGPGVDHSINEYYAAVAEVLGYTGEFSHDLSKPVGMARKLVDVTRLDEFGWRPPTTLTDGIRATHDYYLTRG